MRANSNVAARMGRWSARHRKTAIFGWLAFVVAAFAIGHAIGTKKLDSNDAGVGESARAAQILRGSGFEQPAGEAVLLQSRTLRPGDPAFRAAVADVVARISGKPGVENVRSPLDATNAGQVSQDGRSALVQFEIAGSEELASRRVGPVLDAVAAVQAAHPALRIEEFGDASLTRAFDATIGKDFKRAEQLSIPVTLAILVVAFGALVAAGIPLLLGLTAILAALGLLALPSQIWPADSAVNSVILLIGLAVGVDYSLFYLKREREERSAGRDAESALEAAAATSGRSVLVSGLSVLIAMAGMFLAGDKTFTSIAIGTMLVVAISVVGSLTVLPAVLSKLGDRVDKGRVPFLWRLRRADGEGRLWGAVLDRVLRRPLLAVLLSGGALVALTIPAFGLHTTLPGLSSLPQGLAITKTYDRLQRAFPGGPQPAIVVVKAADVTAPRVHAAIAGLERRALLTGRMFVPIHVDVNAPRTVARITVPLAGDGTNAASNSALQALRGSVIPATLGRVDGVETAVTGLTAASKDFNDQMKSRAPLVFAFVLGLAFLLLLATFRSVVVAAKAIVLNLLSVGAAYGLLVLVFQHGIGLSLLGVSHTTGITAWLPLFLFVVLFGLSMDYHVFVLSRIREAVDRGARTEDAVAHGIRSTAGVVTSAAVIMVAVFSIFATLSIVPMKQLGFGLAAAILLDATIVRAVLLPATMKLLGRWNWYLPRWLEWLPRIAAETASTGSELALRPAGR